MAVDSGARRVTHRWDAASFGGQGAGLSRGMIAAMEAVVASGSAKSFISGAASTIVLQNDDQNFCSSATHATSLPSRNRSTARVIDARSARRMALIGRLRAEAAGRVC